MGVSNCHRLSRNRWTNGAILASLTSRLALSLNLLVLLMNSLKMPGAQCKPTSGITLQQLSSPNNSAANFKTIQSNLQQSGLSRRHESLLVDLLNEQQSDFISKLERADLGVDGGGPTGSGALKTSSLGQQSQQPSSRQIQQTSSWIPIGQQPRQVAESQVKASRQPRAQPCNKSKSKSNAVDQNQQLAVAASSRSVDNVASNSTRSDDQNVTDDDDDDEEEEDEEQLRQRATSDSLDGHESVALESALMPPPPYRGNQYEGEGADDRASSNNMNHPNGPDDDGEEGPPPGGASDSSDTPPDEAAARREQEAAEASEAEAADRSALAEQQAAQREIILAQAQSEAKAIREQQEALLRQQQLQQQILMRRHQNFLDDTDPTASEKKKKRRGGGDTKRPRGSSSSNAQSSAAAPRDRQALSSRMRSPGGGRSRERDAATSDRDRQRNRETNLYNERGLRAQGSSNQQHQTEHQRDDNPPPPQSPINLMDNQFSDQPDTGIVDRGHLALLNSRANAGADNLATQAETGDRTSGEELGSEDSVRRPQFLLAQSDDAALEAALAQSADNLSIGARLNLTTSDLLAAAQHHHYGAHYGSLGGHHKGGHYYQYAESHKKGQFDSGFKRGNKKFVIAGHSSQHKGHAEGHVKWHGKKGKGSHYWDYKHKNKKHYGGGDGYGGGHHYY